MCDDEIIQALDYLIRHCKASAIRGSYYTSCTNDLNTAQDYVNKAREKLNDGDKDVPNKFDAGYYWVQEYQGSDYVVAYTVNGEEWYFFGTTETYKPNELFNIGNSVDLQNIY